MTGKTQSQSPPGGTPDGLLAANQLSKLTQASPGLPEGVWRDQFVEIIIEALRSDLRPADQSVLRFYVQHTRPHDWSGRGLGPVCYVGQLNAAERLHLDRKSVYTAERTLERLGLIEKTSLANGHRRGPRGTRVEADPLGICFAPAIARYEELVALVEIARAEREALTAWRYRVSGLRTKLRIALRDMPIRDSIVEVIATEFDQLPTQIARIPDVDVLVDLDAAFQSLLDDLGEHLDALRRSESNAEEGRGEGAATRKSPHKGGSETPHHIYTTTNPSPVICTRPGEQEPGAYAPDTNLSEPANAGKELRNKDEFDPGPVKPTGSPGGKGRGPVNWTTVQLLSAAGADFRFCLEAVQPNAAALRSDDFVDAAYALSGALGINQSAWAEACAVMGRFEAALALLVLDARRTDPENPVARPGGYLRGMTEKARRGDLNLDASVFALLRRTEDDARRPH